MSTAAKFAIRDLLDYLAHDIWTAHDAHGWRKVENGALQIVTLAREAQDRFHAETFSASKKEP